MAIILCYPTVQLAGTPPTLQLEMGHEQFPMAVFTLEDEQIVCLSICEDDFLKMNSH